MTEALAVIADFSALFSFLFPVSDIKHHPLAIMWFFEVNDICQAMAKEYSLAKAG